MRISPAWASSPPTTMSSGSNRLHRLATAMPMCRPASAMTRWDRPSPASAAWMRSLRRSIPEFGGKSDRRAGPAANVSRQPRLLQRHTGPFSSIVTCPICPALPLPPRKRSPPTMSPALMLWPTRMKTDDAAERPVPSRASASPPRFASLSAKTGRPIRAVRLAATSTPSHPRRSPGVDTIPVRGSIGAGSARPTARRSFTVPPSDSIMSLSSRLRRSSSASWRWSRGSGSEVWLTTLRVASAIAMCSCREL